MTNRPDRAPPLIFGEVLFDLFPDGSSVLGGAPFNVAWHLQAFGQWPLLISRVGEDQLGGEIRRAMQLWGMAMDGLQGDPLHPTGRVEIAFTDGEPSFDIRADQAYDNIDQAGLPDTGSVPLLYHGSLALRDPVSFQALQRLKTISSAPCFVDVNLRPPWWQAETVLGLLNGASWVKLNGDELSELLPGKQDAANLLRERFNLKLLLVTHGGEGAVAYTEDGGRLEIAPAGSVEVVDTVGAGDAFSSVLILGLIRGWPLESSLDRAQAFASAIVGCRGATVAEPNFYQPFIEAWQLKEEEQ